VCRGPSEGAINEMKGKEKERSAVYGGGGEKASNRNVNIPQEVKGTLL